MAAKQNPALQGRTGLRLSADEEVQ